MRRVGPVFRGVRPSNNRRVPRPGLGNSPLLLFWQHNPHAHDQLRATPRTREDAVHERLLRNRHVPAALGARHNRHALSSGASGSLRRCATCPVRYAVPPASIAGQYSPSHDHAA